jgi:hypothetical protein
VRVHRKRNSAYWLFDRYTHPKRHAERVSHAVPHLIDGDRLSTLPAPGALWHAVSIR